MEDYTLFQGAFVQDAINARVDSLASVPRINVGITPHQHPMDRVKGVFVTALLGLLAVVSALIVVGAFVSLVLAW
jgi:hypothetical protein